jgi:hypothetical protein
MCAKSRLRRPPPSCSAPSLNKDEDADEDAGLTLPLSSQAISLSPTGCGVDVSGISSVSIALPSAGLLPRPPPELSMSTSLTLDLSLECVLFLDLLQECVLSESLECVVCSAFTFDELDAARIRRVYSARRAEARGDASASSFGSDSAPAFSLAGSRLLCPLLSYSGRSSLSLASSRERLVGCSSSARVGDSEIEGLSVEGLGVLAPLAHALSILHAVGARSA